MHHFVVKFSKFSSPQAAGGIDPLTKILRMFLTGATENAGFNAKVQRNLGLDFVTKQHKSLQKVYSLVH